MMHDYRVQTHLSINFMGMRHVIFGINTHFFLIKEFRNFVSVITSFHDPPFIFFFYSNGYYKSV